MKLPGGDRAIIDARKISDYILNSTYPRGRHKARVFLSAFGIGVRDSEFLYKALEDAARKHEAVLGDADMHGQRFVIDFILAHNGRSATVRSHWIVLSSGGPPRFVTAFVRD